MPLHTWLPNYQTLTFPTYTVPTYEPHVPLAVSLPVHMHETHYPHIHVFSELPLAAQETAAWSVVQPVWRAQAPIVTWFV